MEVLALCVTGRTRAPRGKNSVHDTALRPQRPSPGCRRPSAQTPRPARGPGVWLPHRPLILPNILF